MPNDALLAKPEQFTITLTDSNNTSTILRPGTPSKNMHSEIHHHEQSEKSTHSETEPKNDKAAIFLEHSKKNNDFSLMIYAAEVGYVNALFELAQFYAQKPESRFCLWSTNYTQFALCLYLTLLVQMQNPFETQKLSAREIEHMTQISHQFINTHTRQNSQHSSFAKWAQHFIEKTLPKTQLKMISHNKTIRYILTTILLTNDKNICDYYMKGITQALHKSSKSLTALIAGKTLPLNKTDKHEHTQPQTSIAKNF